jgi:hypothetical protein
MIAIVAAVLLAAIAGGLGIAAAVTSSHDAKARVSGRHQSGRAA